MTDIDIDATLDRLDDAALLAQCIRIPADADDSSGTPACIDDELDVTSYELSELQRDIASVIAGMRSIRTAARAPA
jgi:hypothetical protein